MSRGSRLWITLAVVVAVGAIAAYSLHALRDEARAVDEGVVAFKKGEYEKALMILTPFAEQGNQAAELNVGLAYAFGLGTAQNRDKAKELLKASTGGRSSEMFLWIAQCFEKGDGVPVNPNEAFAWYRISADAGNTKAEAWLKTHTSPSNGQ